jgi:hypothetical protein
MARKIIQNQKSPCSRSLNEIADHRWSSPLDAKTPNLTSAFSRHLRSAELTFSCPAILHTLPILSCMWQQPPEILIGASAALQKISWL